MAVLIEGISVVIRLVAIQSKYPGGRQAFHQQQPNRTLCEDESLARVGFMNPKDVQAYVAMLERKGLIFERNGEAVDFVVVDQNHGPTGKVNWLNLGKVQIEGHDITIGWFGEEYDGQVAFPEDWTPEGALQFVDPEEMDDRMKFLRRENGIEVYLNLRTGKEMFVGRPEVQGGGPASAKLALEAICQEALQLEAKLEPLLALQDQENADPLIKRLAEELLPAAIAWADDEGKDLALAHYAVGLVLRILRAPAKAESFFRRANALKPGNQLILRELVKCLGEQDRGSEALPYAREAVEVSPMDAAAWGNLTMCLIQCGQREEARKALREALIIDPQDRLNRYISDNFEGYFKQA